MKIKINRAIKAGLTAAGAVEVEDGVLHFTTTGVVGALLRSQAFSIPLHRIAELRWQRRSSQVVLVDLSGEEYALQGPNGAQLVVSLWARGVGRADPATLADAQIHYQGIATLSSGPMHFKGHLAVGDHGLFWESTGSVEQLVGVSGIRLPVEDIAATEPLSDGARVTAADGTVSRFLCKDAEHFVSTLVAQFHKATPDVEPDDAHGAVALFFPAVLRLADEKVTAQGTVTVTAEGDLYATTYDGRTIGVDGAAVQILAYDDPSEHLTLLELPTPDHRTLRLWPQGGPRGVRALMEFSRSLPVLASVAPKNHTLLSRVVGTVESVRTSGRLAEELGIRQATVVQSDRTLAILRPEGNDWSIRGGTRVRLLVGTGRHLIEITARYLGVFDHDKDERLRGWPNDLDEGSFFEFAVLNADAVKMLPTRRETFRVTSGEEVSIFLDGDRGQETIGRLYNLSLGGCGVLLRDQQPLDGYMEMELQLADGRMDLAVQVVFTESYRLEGIRWWRHGCQFRRLDTNASTRLAREVTLREIRASKGYEDH